MDGSRGRGELWPIPGILTTPKNATFSATPLFKTPNYCRVLLFYCRFFAWAGTGNESARTDRVGQQGGSSTHGEDDVHDGKRGAFGRAWGKVKLELENVIGLSFEFSTELEIKIELYF